MLKFLLQNLLLPLIAGGVVMIGGIILPRYFPEHLELSYWLEGPNSLIDEGLDGADIRIEVNGKKAERVFVNRVRLRNSGSKEMVNLDVVFLFRPTPEGFAILSLNHKTKPEYNFGAITEVHKANTSSSRKIIYELLDRDDEDVVTFISTHKAQMEVHPKLAGLLKKNRTNEETNGLFGIPWKELITIYLAALWALALRALYLMYARRQAAKKAANE